MKIFFKKKKLTDEALIRHVVKFMRKQNAQARGPFGCANITKDGRRCAIGCCFIKPDDFTNELLQEQLVKWGASKQVVRNLQISHDFCYQQGSHQEFSHCFEKMFKERLPAYSDLIESIK